MTTVHRLLITDWHPVRLNVLMRSHWTVRRRLKGADAQVVTYHAMAQGLEKATTPRAVAVTLYRPRGQSHCDPDAPLKSVLDALKAAGLLVDDSPAWLTGVSVHHATGPKATLIELTDTGRTAA